MEDWIGYIIILLLVSILTELQNMNLSPQEKEKRKKLMRKYVWWGIGIAIVFLILLAGFIFWLTKNY